MDNVNEILKKRAKALAVHDQPSDNTAGKALAVVKFVLAPDTYAIDASMVTEVILLRELTPLPGVPSFLAGITNVRGKIVSIVDLKKYLGIKQVGISEHNRVILLSDERMEFGVLTDAIVGTDEIFTETLLEIPNSRQIETHRHIHGITPDGILWLNIAGLLSDAGLIIDQKN